MKPNKQTSLEAMLSPTPAQSSFGELFPSPQQSDVSVSVRRGRGHSIHIFKDLATEKTHEAIKTGEKKKGQTAGAGDEEAQDFKLGDFGEKKDTFEAIKSPTQNRRTLFFFESKILCHKTPNKTEKGGNCPLFFFFSPIADAIYHERCCLLP